MLLKHTKILLCVLCIIILNKQANSQSIQSGIAYLSKTASIINQTGSGFYTFNYNSNKSDLIIAISSFSSISTITSCYILNKTNSQTNFTCTNNIVSVSYLFYQRTPLIYSNAYNYHFYSKNYNYSTLWSAPLNMTIIQHPQIRAIISGFKTIDNQNMVIQLSPSDDNKSINISRTLNVRVVNFSFILIQNYSPYNITIFDQPVSQFPKISFSGTSASYINFWGIQTLKYSANNQNSNNSLTVNLNSALQNYNILSIQSFAISNNLIVGGLFLSSSKIISTLSCGSLFYDPYFQNCSQTCPPSLTLKWTTDNTNYLYCLHNSSLSTNQTFTSNNLADMSWYTPIGCLKPFLLFDESVSCNQCSPGYLSYYDRCVCAYGSYLNQNQCLPCDSTTCSLNTQINSEVVQQNTTTVTINLAIILSNNVNYLHYSSPQFQIELQINNIVYNAQVNFDNSTLTLLLSVINVPQALNYQISTLNNQTNISSLFYLQTQVQFLWTLQLQTQAKEQQQSQSILTSIAPVFSNTDKSVPILFLIAFFIGDKINTLSIFQTVSLIYLVNFIPIDKQYNSLLTVIQQVFVFQPEPIFHIFGANNSLIQIDSFDNLKVQYNQLIYQYTQGKLFLSMSANNLIILILQITIITLLVKLIKKILQKSPNKIIPSHHQQRLNLNRSKKLKNSTLQWIPQLKVREEASFRYKMYIFFSYLDQKKYVKFTSFILTQLLSFSLFIIYQLAIPIYSSDILISRTICLTVAIIILLYPLFLIKYEPLYLLKCVSIIYKRKSYTLTQIWLYFYLIYIENIIYPIIIITVTNSTVQVTLIILILILKVTFLRKNMKKIQILRCISIIIFFITIFTACILPNNQSVIVLQAIFAALILVIFCEIMKLLRSITIVILNIFKEKPKQPTLESKKQTNKEKIQVVELSQNNEIKPDIKQTEQKNEKVVKKRKNRHYLFENKQNQLVSSSQLQQQKPISFQQRRLQRKLLKLKN